MYESDGPLEYMDDILIRTERGVREVTTKERGNLKGYPSSWGTTLKDRRQIIQEPILHFWSVLGDACAMCDHNGPWDTDDFQAATQCEFQSFKLLD
jgi:hypothetical protein